MTEALRYKLVFPSQACCLGSSGCGWKGLVLTLDSFSPHSHLPIHWGWRAGGQRQVHSPLQMGTFSSVPLACS